MLRKSWLTFCAVVTLALVASVAHAQDKIRVLQITGDDVSAHDWRLISNSTLEVLEASEKFDVKVCEDPMILESAAALENYDVIVFLPYLRNAAALSDQAKENLVAFVESGGGFYSQHLASACFKGWDDFAALCGRNWVMGTSGHGPRHIFEVDIVKDHPITRGVESFETSDELYAKLQGDLDIEVLATADSPWSGNTEPMLFVRTVGQGRCVHCPLGHDDVAIENPGVAKLIRQSVEWAATGDVK